MQPAFSVILFTTLSGAGYGLFVWIGAMIATSRLELFARGSDPAASLLLIMLAMAALIVGGLLTAIGLLSSTFHLGKPLRAWRAFSQWRTSWLSREGVLALLTYVPALALLVLLQAALHGGGSGQIAISRLVPWVGAALAVLSLLTVACTAMIYACLKPIPAWRHRLVVPVYLAFALLTGMALVAALAALAGGDVFPGTALRYFAGVLAVLAIALSAMKLAYWRDLDRTPLTLTRGDAVGLPGREVDVFERPHTQDNYLTREMGFVVARKHARALRVIALGLFGVVPLLLALLTWAMPGAAVLALPTAALSALGGSSSAGFFSPKPGTW